MSFLERIELWNLDMDFEGTTSLLNYFTSLYNTKCGEAHNKFFYSIISFFYEKDELFSLKRSCSLQLHYLQRKKKILETKLATV